MGRRLALAARAVTYLEEGVVHEGPTLSGVQILSPQRTSAALTFSAATAGGLHLAGTGGCTNCCKQPPSQPYYFPFETMAPNGSWIGASVSAVRGHTLILAAAAPISAVRHNWGGYPDCSVYSGVGGPDNRSALAAAPFRRCLYGATADLPAWSYYSDCSPLPTGRVAFVPPGHVAAVPTAQISDFVLNGITPTRCRSEREGGWR